MKSPGSILGAGGVLEKTVEGFHARPSQVDMADHVEKVFGRGGFLLAEAGTGTGKTLAYLVPAVLSKKNTIVSTATRHLQEQTAATARMLFDLLDGPAAGKVTVLKGRSNYACKRKLFAIPLIGADDKSRAIHGWSMTTPDGDRAGCADIPEDDPSWRAVVSDFEDCLSFKCPLRSDCFLEKAKEEARRSRLVVVNHHLLFSDVAGGGESKILPDMNTVILDEAHAVAQIAAQCLGVRADRFVMAGAVTAAVRLFRPRSRDHKTVKKLAGETERLAAMFFASFSSGAAQKRRYDRFDINEDTVQYHLALDGALARLCEILDRAGKGDDAPAELNLVTGRLSRIRATLATLVEAKDESFVYYSESSARGVSLAAEPIEPGAVLRERFYPSLETAVFSSATLSTGGDMEYSVSRLGLSDLGCEAISFPSPFDYFSQSALCLLESMPDPNSPAFTGSAVEAIKSLVGITGGRAFVLCTSRRQMESYYNALSETLPYDVFVQGGMPKREILERFRTGRPGVLFATASFWEGVDVPGDALSLVIIDRLPFDPPDDPVNQARSELAKSRGLDPFRSFQLPEAALALKQGFGRLIRTITDRGIVAILDPRIVSKSYGRYFLKTLPAMNVFTDLDDVRAWWDKKA